MIWMVKRNKKTKMTAFRILQKKIAYAIMAVGKMKR